MNGKVGEVRPSQLITTFGPGSIVDLRDLSVIISGINHWDISLCESIIEPRLCKKLEIRKILSPPIPKNDSNQGTLPAFVFPNFLVCPSCRRLDRSEKYYHNNDVYYCHCSDSDPPKVFPARFIVACPAGHIDDFPWRFFVHHKEKDYGCPGDDLVLIDRESTGAISDVTVKCKRCNSERSLGEAFKSGEGFKCFGKRPWLNVNDRESCHEKTRAALRGASNLYFPAITSALVIPPYHDPLHIIIAENEERFKKMDDQEKLRNAIDMGLLPELESYSVSDIWKAIENLRAIKYGPEQDLLYPEWEALLRCQHDDPEYDFETERPVVPEKYTEYISDIVMVRRLAEVRALTGFTRINPPPDLTDLLAGDEDVAPLSNITPISNRNLGWIPGIKTRGEGLFIALNESKIRDWETRGEVINAVTAMETIYRKFCEERKMQVDLGTLKLDARYVLLHTLSHALIRQLCVNSGYSSTALRERIYSSCISGHNMAGLLIYTATPDSEGSLGGLVELGMQARFGNILWQVLQEALFCSGDPLCAEHKPETLGDINGASCHACTLASETSCECSNKFLDRSFLVPTISTGKLAYFSEG